MTGDTIARRGAIGAPVLALILALTLAPGCRSATPQPPRSRPAALDGVRKYLAYRPSYGPQGRAPVTVGNYAGYNYRSPRSRAVRVPAPPIAEPVTEFGD